MVDEALGHLLCAKIYARLIKGITLAKPKIKQLVIGHFVEDSFLTILQEDTSW
jgi:hypothetical protein